MAAAAVDWPLALDDMGYTLSGGNLPLGTSVHVDSKSFTPGCELCEYRGKPQPSMGRAKAALKQHACGNTHRQQVRREHRR